MTQDQIEASRVRVTRPDPRETIWRMNIDALAAGAYGDPKSLASLIRYWKDQAAVGFPGALENLKYFEELAKHIRPKTVEERVAEIAQAMEFCERVGKKHLQQEGETTP